jgi:ubiquinone/menaquinone biosynthesis C-methylase UbiE
MVILTAQDKKNIENMLSHCTRYCMYPSDDYDRDQIKDWMIDVTSGKSGDMSRQDWLRAWREDPHWATSMKPSPLARELVSIEAENKTKGSILEIGCGNGRDSIHFGKQGHYVIGIDISPDAIKIAKKNNKLETVNFEVGDAEKLRFDTGSFDAVYSLSVLHATKLEKSVSEVARVLKQKGLALFYLYVKTVYFDDEDKEKGRVEVNFKVSEMDKLLAKNKLQILDKYRSESEDEDENGKHIHSIIVYFLRRK